MQAKELHCHVIQSQMLTPTVFELKFEASELLNFIAGQFISIIIPKAGPHGRDLRRAYSIASSPEMTPLELCIKLVDDGRGTQYLYSLKPGDSFRGIAPYGDFVYHPEANKKVCFIATGTGIAPFRSILNSNYFKKHPPEQVSCYFGVRTEEELLYTDFFSNYAGLHFVPTVSQPSQLWTGLRGRVTDQIRKLECDWQETDFFLCGHGAMILEVKDYLLEHGVQKKSIHQEIYYK